MLLLPLYTVLQAAIERQEGLRDGEDSGSAGKDSPCQRANLPLP
jgi:hypothetical protein